MLAINARQIAEKQIKKEKDFFDENGWVQEGLKKIHKSIEESVSIGYMYDIYDITNLSLPPQSIDKQHLIDKIKEKLVQDGYQVVYPLSSFYMKISW